MLTIMTSQLIPGVAEALQALPEGEVCHLLAAVSGGADSTALLYALKELRKRDGFLLSCVHVDHGLRGDDSSVDAAFVASLCKQWKVPFFHRQVTCLAPGMPGLEAAARQARYEAISQVYAGIGATALLTAHHQADQAETLLMNLIRGTGLAGLCGIAADSCRMGMRILRPLLSYPPALLRRALEEVHVSWREDASNQVPDNRRNFLRLQVLPLLESLAPGCQERMAATAANLAPIQSFLSEAAASLLKEPGLISLSALQDAPEALQTHSLRLWTGVSLSQEQTRALHNLLAAPVGSSVNLPEDLRAYRGSRYLHLLPAPERSYRDAIGQEPFRGDVGDGIIRQAVPEAWALKACLRTRQEGDRISPFGMKGSMSLQDYLVNRKVDQPFRDGMPLLACGSEILWVPGVGASRLCRLDPGQPARVFTLTSPLPWQLTE